MLQILTGQVYSLDQDTYVAKKGTPQAEDRTWVTFRLGMAKPYLTEVADGNGGTEEQRQKTFATIKCFNGLADTIAKYFAGDENKGKWIQLFGHWEENNWNQKVEVENPHNSNEVFELDVPVKRLEFIVSHFNFVGNPPAQTQVKPKTQNGIAVTVKTKTPASTGGNAVNSAAAARAAEEAILSPSDSDAPF